MEDEALNAIVQDHAHGVAGITTLGSLGDSLYEPSTYNAFVSALRAYRAVAETNSKKRISPRNANDHGSIFRGFVEFVKKSPEWKAIEKHVKVAGDRNDSSWIINGFVDGDFSIFIIIKINFECFVVRVFFFF